MPPEIAEPGAMHAHASLATTAAPGPDGHITSQVTALRSGAPLTLRLTEAKDAAPWADSLRAPARVSVAAGAAGPVGGDQLALDIDVGPGSALVLTDISPTVLLPGPQGRESRTTTRVRVHDGATLVWLPEPLIAAANCRHLNDIRITLAATARLLMREELILGRHGEQPGAIRQRLDVRRGGSPLYRQDLCVGGHAWGWDSAAVTAGHRAVGSVLVVDPRRAWPAHSSLPTDTAAVLPLAGPAVVITALADDNLDLRTALTAGLAQLGTPWQTETSSVSTEEEPCRA